MNPTMTTTETTKTAKTTKTTATRALGAWRPALVASGLLLAAGGPLHPEAETSGSVSRELAEMTSDPLWVTGHALIVVSTVLLAAALWGMHRQRGVVGLPARAAHALRLAAVAVSLYVVETVFHLAATIDSDTLADGGFAPVASTHLALAIVLYPLSGWAVAALALALARTWRGPRRVVAVLGVLGGTLHAVSAPVALLLPDAPVTPLFAGAGMSLALWSIGTGLVGAPQAGRPSRPAVTRPLLDA